MNKFKYIKLFWYLVERYVVYIGQSGKSLCISMTLSFLKTKSFIYEVNRLENLRFIAAWKCFADENKNYKNIWLQKRKKEMKRIRFYLEKLLIQSLTYKLHLTDEYLKCFNQTLSHMLPANQFSILNRKKSF